MAFDLVPARARIVKAVTCDPDVVAAGFYRRHKRSDDWQLVVYIGVNVLKRIGADSDGARVFVREGKGADHGFFQITPAPVGAPDSYCLSRRSVEISGAKPSVVNNRTLSVSAKRLASLCRRNEIFLAEPVVFQAFGSALTIAVPFVHAPEKENLP